MKSRTRDTTVLLAMCRATLAQRDWCHRMSAAAQVPKKKAVIMAMGTPCIRANSTDDISVEQMMAVRACIRGSSFCSR